MSIGSAHTCHAKGVMGGGGLPFGGCGVETALHARSEDTDLRNREHTRLTPTANTQQPFSTSVQPTTTGMYQCNKVCTQCFFVIRL